MADLLALLRNSLGHAASAGQAEEETRAVTLPPLSRRGDQVIVLFNPRATRPRNCRLPLSVLALAAVLEGREQYAVVDGNIDNDPIGNILRLIDQHTVELLGVTCMPGPQMA